MGTTPRPELPIPFPRRRPWVPASPRRCHGMTTAPSPEGMRGRGDPVCSVERHAQRVLDGAYGLDLVVGALGTAAADDLQDVRGHPATVDDGVSGGLDHGGTPGLGVPVFAGDPGGPLHLDLARAQLLELGKRRFALVETGPSGLERELGTEALHRDHDVRAESPLHPGLSRRDLHPWHGQRLPVVRDLDGDPWRSGEVRARVLDALCHGSAPFVPPLTTANISGPPRQDEGPSGVSARAPPVHPARGSARQLEEVLSCSLPSLSADSPSSDTELMICCSAGTISLCHWPPKRSASGPVQSTSARPLVSSCSILVISSAASRS